MHNYDYIIIIIIIIMTTFMPKIRAHFALFTFSMFWTDIDLRQIL